MSNKLKSLSANQIEYLIQEAISKYLNEECSCKITNLSTPYIDSEENIALNDKRSLHFEVQLSYEE